MNLLNSSIQIDAGDLGQYVLSWVDPNGPVSKRFLSFDDLTQYLVDMGFAPEPTT